MIKNNKILCLLSYNEYLLKLMMGTINIEINKDMAGVLTDKSEFIISEFTKFLLKSFNASLKGCKIPIIPTLLGPFRICIYLKIFRSRIV